jgi:hypothetical protein
MIYSQSPGAKSSADLTSRRILSTKDGRFRGLKKAVEWAQ